MSFPQSGKAVKSLKSDRKNEKKVTKEKVKYKIHLHNTKSKENKDLDINK